MPLLIRRKAFLRSRNHFLQVISQDFVKYLVICIMKTADFLSAIPCLAVHTSDYQCIIPVTTDNHYCNTRLIGVNDHHHHWHFKKSRLSQNRNIPLTGDTEASTFTNFWGLFIVFWPRTSRSVHFGKGKQKGRRELLEIRRVNDYNSIFFFLSLKDRYRT